MSAGSGGRDEQWLGLKLDCIDENGLPALDGYLKQRLCACTRAGRGNIAHLARVKPPVTRRKELIPQEFQFESSHAITRPSDRSNSTLISACIFAKELIDYSNDSTNRLLP